MRVNYLFIFLFVVLFYLTGGSRGIDVTQPILPYGVEPYSTSGTCEFNFYLLLDNDFSATFDGIRAMACSLSATATNPMHDSINCNNVTPIYVNSTHVYLIVYSTVEVDTYLDIYLSLSISKGMRVVELRDINKEKIQYTCQAPPTYNNWFVSGTETRLVNTSFQLSTNRFQNYITIDKVFTRPLPEGYFYSSEASIKLKFTYITPQVYLMDYQFDITSTDKIPTTLNIMATSGTFTTIENPLARLAYTSLDVDAIQIFNFDNLPYMGTVLYYRSQTKMFPSLNVDFTPYSLTDTAILYFKSKDQTQIKIQVNNKFDSYGPETKQASPTGPSLDVGYMATERFALTSIATRARISFYSDYLAEPFYWYYPYGVVLSGGNRGTNISFPIVLPDSPSAVFVHYGKPEPYTTPLVISTQTETNLPYLKGYTLSVLDETTSVLQLEMGDDSGVYYASVNTSTSVFYVKMSHLVLGSSKMGKYEIYVPFKTATAFSVGIMDFQLNLKVYNYHLMNSEFGTPLLDQNIRSRIQSIEFSPNVGVNVESNGVDLQLFIGLNHTDVERDIVFVRVYLNPNIPTQTIYGVYDEKTNIYQFSPIRLPQNLMSAFLNYSVFINEQEISSDILMGMFGKSAELYVENKGNFDMMFPHVISFTPPQTNVVANGETELGWSFDFSDSFGIDTMIVGIAGDFDIRGQNFTCNGKGDKSYTCKVTYNISQEMCRSQTYFINYIYTNDTLGNQGEYVRESATSLHPLFIYENSLSTYDIVLVCPTSADETAPTIEELVMTQIGFEPYPIIQAKFSARDETPGINDQYTPVCFLTAINNQIISAPAKQTTITGFVRYQCEFANVPYGFGPYAVLSIFGLADKHYNFAKVIPVFTAHGNYTNEIMITQPTNPYIKSASSLEISSKKLILYGHNLLDTVVHIISKHPDSETLVIPDISTGSSLVLLDITPAYEYIIQVNHNTNKIVSNTIVLKGPLPLPSSSDDSSGSSDSMSPSPSPTPTTTPVVKKCGSDCGAPQGYGKCVNGGCVCNSPHSGIDCKSVIDTTPVITPDPVKPFVNVTIPGTNSGQTPKFISFVYVVALRELDNTDTLINNYVFNSDKWILVEGGSSKNEQVTTVQYKYVIDNLFNTTIVSTVQVFEKETNVTFGNQQLFMNPSTIKFTFNITSYPFSKSTNSLQLVINAALQSTEKVACSYKEFVDDQGNSQYLKLQIEDRSLFGRFIKFGMIDGREQVVSNSLLDNIYGGKELSKSTSDQSYIGLNIPYYNKYALLDPDFSVLVEQNTARDQANSICTSESKKLTNAQLAGIIVGGAVFIFIVVGLVIYLYTRNSSSTIAMKLRKIAK
ncbi:hypothetical protein CYY_008988 [Polysphondylium violaceum]|uniref:EGF-like domain-containing protein n=1 Tax=Polysphondylium violaceum TaxID=133409 RepID=A0A8J4PMC3_9MYCE|nr:hypothetical protein CYY_008988 [Polysphondylium violaceum]